MEYVFGFMIVLVIAHLRVLWKVSDINDELYAVEFQLDRLRDRFPEVDLEENPSIFEYRRTNEEDRYDE